MEEVQKAVREVDLQQAVHMVREVVQRKLVVEGWAVPEELQLVVNMRVVLARY